MVICPRCNIEHEIGEEYCRKCGSFLLTEEPPIPPVEKPKIELICPVCKLPHVKGNYCKKCGSQLIQGIPFRQTDHFPRKRSVKKQSKDWLRLLREKRELQACVGRLESQRSKISSDVLDPLSIRYEDRLESLSSSHREMTTELIAVKKGASDEIDSLEEELKSLRKRAEDYQFLFEQGGITRTDFNKAKHETGREIALRKKRLKKNRQVLSLLPREIGGTMVPPGVIKNRFRPGVLLAVSGILILMGAGGYYLRAWHSGPGNPNSNETSLFPSSPFTLQGTGPGVEDREADMIRSLFETVKEANLQKNIDLFMGCFSRDFNGKDKKRRETLEMWGHFNYLILSYDLEKPVISGDTADVRLAWLVKVTPKNGGKLQENRVVLDTHLKKEDGRWKIKEIRPAG